MVDKRRREDGGLWSYNTGRRGVNWVRVYERDVSPQIYVEWRLDGKRHQRALSSITGSPVTDRRLAMKIANKMSKELERDANKRAAKFLERDS